MTSFMPAFGSFSFTLFAFVVSLSIIVFVHEYGHYIVGRWSGIHAEVFSVGLGPVLYSRVDRRGTKWQIALIPFGGYVKFLGDANIASAPDGSDPSLLQNSADVRHTMQGAPLWARSATVAAGPLFNFMLAIAIFSGIALWQGQARDPLSVGELYSTPYDANFERGDVFLKVDGVTVPSLEDGQAFSAFLKTLSGKSEHLYEISRQGDVLQVKGPGMSPARVVQIMPRSAAADARLMQGDVILAVNTLDISNFNDLKQIVEISQGAELRLKIWRDGEIIETTLVPKRVDEQKPDGQFETAWRIGIIGGEFFFEPELRTLGVADAFGFGASQTWRIMKGSVEGLYYVVTGAISTCNLSGPIGIAETSGQMARQGSENFIWFIALMSAAIGMINLFPIPVLDGGHLMFFAYEAVARRPPAPAFLNAVMYLGFAVILSFMSFALINDVLC